MRLSAGEWAGVVAGVLLAGSGLAYMLWKPKPSDGSEGDVTTSEDPTSPDSPAALAAGAGVDLRTYALARAIASEAGGSARAAQIAVGWSVVNYANAHKRGDVVKAVLGSASAFGRQGSGGRGYVSSARAPLSSQLKLAADILTGAIGDPTFGATNFDSPREQQREFDAGEVKKTPDEVAAERTSQGLVAYDVDVGAADFRFWGPA